MPLLTTKGAASTQGFGQALSTSTPTYVEDVFSTFLYTGNSSTQTITNNIDLSTKGGLVWIKDRVNSAYISCLFDTARGASKRLRLYGNANGIQDTVSGVSAFNTTGFTVGSDLETNTTGDNIVSWTFREQPKFFDVVTWTGSGANRTIAHNLGSVPGFIIVKRTDAAADWQCYHRSLANTQYIVLNSTAEVATGATRWNSTTPTSTVFSLGTDATVNASGGTYVAYIYAHDAGGFGLTGADNVVSCGSYVGTGNAFNVTLGWEPQFVLVKAVTGTYASVSDWMLFDNLRKLTADTFNNALSPNLSAVEGNNNGGISINATGIAVQAGGTYTNVNGTTFIYIAIRRGPMKVPTLGTSVYNTIVRTGTTSITTMTGAGFPVDLAVIRPRALVSGLGFEWADRLRGPNLQLFSNNTATENTYADHIIGFDTQDGYRLGADSSGNVNQNHSNVNFIFKRAPGFFDEVCYTGDGTSNPARSISHSLGVKPEFAILKSRSASGNWLSVVNIGSSYVYSSAVSNFGLNLTSFPAANLSIGTTYVSATAFQLGFLVPDIDVSATQRDKVNANSATYVAYLFATCPGVSKVGTYTGNGTNQTIACGFTSGARFILIKRTDSTGDWYIWDTVRGIIAGNDPHLSINTIVAEVTTDDSIDADSTGFIVNQLSATNINVTSATYIFLAIA